MALPSLHEFPWLTTVIVYPVVAALFIPVIPAPAGDPTTRAYAQKFGGADPLVCPVCCGH
jgi:NAD(P)H-quinone oxidoreductase subunit 4